MATELRWGTEPLDLPLRLGRELWVSLGSPGQQLGEKWTCHNTWVTASEGPP
jgi:hypothetical protein